jgi:hypothetical protein
MLKEFVELIDSDEEMVDIKNLFTTADRRKWEKWIDIFETIQIDSVASGLKDVSETYKLNKTEEITILAYVKFLELMIAKVELAGRMDKEMKEAVGKHSPSRTNEVMYG